MLSTDTWRTIALLTIAVGQTAFVLLYMTFPWWRSFLGRALFYKALAFATIIDVGLYARARPEVADWDVVFVVLYFFLAVGVWFQFFAFLIVAITKDRDDWQNSDARDKASGHREDALDEREDVSRNREGALDDRETGMNAREASQGNREVVQDSRESSQDSRESSQDSRDSEWRSRE